MDRRAPIAPALLGRLATAVSCAPAPHLAGPTAADAFLQADAYLRFARVVSAWRTGI